MFVIDKIIEILTLPGLKKCDKNFNFKKRNTQEKNFLCEEISIKYHVLLALNHTHKTEGTFVYAVQKYHWLMNLFVIF